MVQYWFWGIGPTYPIPLEIWESLIIVQKRAINIPPPNAEADILTQDFRLKWLHEFICRRISFLITLAMGDTCDRISLSPPHLTRL